MGTGFDNFLCHMNLIELAPERILPCCEMTTELRQGTRFIKTTLFIELA